ncbi:MAG: amidase [Actinomycetia bacterium]|nr:amidase [Actinomycetes bacterium]
MHGVRRRFGAWLTRPFAGRWRKPSRPIAEASSRPSRWRVWPPTASTRSVPWPCLHRTDQLAFEQTRAVETAYRDGTAGPLAGVPVSIKDAFHIEGLVTTVGSLARKNGMRRAEPGTVRCLRAAGAVYVGKTSTPEFSQSVTTDNLLGPDTANPWDPSRTTGGSSGWASASVMAASCILAPGSYGGGSIPIPAALCGLVGVKPTYGAVGEEGGFEGDSPLACPGAVARSVADAAVVLAVLRGDDDLTPERRDGLRVAWWAHPEDRPVDPAASAPLADTIVSIDGLGHVVSETRPEL